MLSCRFFLLSVFVSTIDPFPRSRRQKGHRELPGAVSLRRVPPSNKVRGAGLERRSASSRPKPAPAPGASTPGAAGWTKPRRPWTRCGRNSPGDARPGTAPWSPSSSPRSVSGRGGQPKSGVWPASWSGSSRRKASIRRHWPPWPSSVKPRNAKRPPPISPTGSSRYLRKAQGEPGLRFLAGEV
jgi:hypothetical protein